MKELADELTYMANKAYADMLKLDSHSDAAKELYGMWKAYTRAADMAREAFDRSADPDGDIAAEVRATL